jgi:hypothetical protein
MRQWLIAIAATFALALLMTFPGFLPGRVFLPIDHPRDLGAWKPDPQARYEISNKIVSDPIYEYLAWDREVRRLLEAGEMPWRNGWAGDGAHLFANPETALLFPFTWPRLVFGDRGWALMALLKLWAGALGMWWLSGLLAPQSRQLFRILAGAIYATSGYMTVWLLFPHTNVYSVLPWLAGCALLFLRKPDRNRAMAVIVTAFLATAGGHPETLFHGVIALAVFFAITHRHEPRRLFAAAGLAAAGFAIVAIQLVPFVVALSKSDIVKTRGAAESHHVRVFAAAAQVLPGFLGSPLRGELDLSGIAQPAAENFNERSGGYAGAIAVLILALAWRGLSRELRVGVLVGIAALIISWRLPGIDHVVRVIPPFSLAANERFGLAFIFFASAALPAAITGVGQRKRTGIAVAVLAAILAIGALAPVVPAGRNILIPAARKGIAVMQQRQFLKKPPAYYEERMQGYLAGVRSVAVRRVALPAILICAAGVALTLRRQRDVILAIAAAAETIIFAWGYSPAVPAHQGAPIPPVIAGIRALDPAAESLIAASTSVYDANLGTIHNVRDIRSYDVLQTHERIEHLSFLGFNRDSRAFPPELSADAVRRFAGEGIRFFLSRSAPPGTRLVAGGPPPAVGAYELPNAQRIARPANDPPDGLTLGILLTFAGIGAALALVMYLPYHEF